jgi:hypothetical protein
MHSIRLMFTSAALALTLLGCEEPKKTTPPTEAGETTGAQDEGTGLPGVLDPKARMDEAKKGYQDAIDVKTKGIERGVERSLGEGGGE